MIPTRVFVCYGSAKGRGQLLSELKRLLPGTGAPWMEADAVKPARSIIELVNDALLLFLGGGRR